MRKLHNSNKRFNFSCLIHGLIFLGILGNSSLLYAAAKIEKQAHNSPDFYFKQIKITYPQFVGFKNPLTQSKLNQALIKSAENFIKPCLNSLEPEGMTAEQAKTAAAMLLNGSTVCAYTTQVIQNNAYFVVVQYSQDYRFLGQQGAAKRSKKALNFDMQKEKILTLSDIFRPNIAYKSKLSQLILAHLKQNQNIQGYAFGLTATAILSYLEEDHFMLDRKELVIYFDPATLAADVVGVIEVRIPYTEIAALLTPFYSSKLR